MATIKINQFRARQFGGASPFGNLTTLPFKLETSATGAALAISRALDMRNLPKMLVGPHRRGVT